MGVQHVGQSELVRFAEERVNLRRDDAQELRAQANRLRERLEQYLDEHPDFELRKLLLSGSLAKGTALKSTSDADIACYVSSKSAPHAISQLVEWLAKKLESAFPNFKPEQIKRKTYSVGVTFAGTGNEVDIVPILYDNDPQWRGNLFSQDDGTTLMTSVPMHLEFIRRRKQANQTHYAQVVRLLKYWAALRKQEDDGFRLKSFMLELIVAHLADKGLALDDYIEAMAAVFAYIASDAFRTTISFADYYSPNTCKATSDPIRIWDPVNCENNVARLYTASHRERIVEAAVTAGDAVDSAIHAITKGESVRYWQKVFGPSFSA
ncbi:MAG TPA: CBASS oligonucleotide cyclase [Gemmatimonadaceae bacterium]|jgi:tRNA nucleotidyltransferase (CCA-adding enzyme)